MSLLSPLAKSIPPEATSIDAEGSLVPDQGPEYSRFMELVDQGLIWDPDRAAEGRLAADEAIQLENRGITPDLPEAPQSPKVKPLQAEFWRKQTAHKNSVAARLREAGMTEEADKLELCHSYYTVAVCCGCNSVQKFPNRCDLFYCPECQPTLSRERKKQVEWWTATIRQPKHVVLTTRNQPTLDPAHVTELRRWFTNLRNRKRYRNWSGGFYTIECTNEGRGWHLHLHILVDVKWIDSGQLALDWDNVTNHNGRIVKVKDCRREDYLQEVTKYAVKGSDLAKWNSSDVAAYIRAFDGKRTFGVFGSLYSARTEFAEFIATMKAAKPRCECGCCRARYFSESEWEFQCVVATPQARAMPPPHPETPALQLDIAFIWPD
jgi:hypothetical protein